MPFCFRVLVLEHAELLILQTNVTGAVTHQPETRTCMSKVTLWEEHSMASGLENMMWEDNLYVELNQQLSVRECIIRGGHDGNTQPYFQVDSVATCGIAANNSPTAHKPPLGTHQTLNQVNCDYYEHL